MEARVPKALGEEPPVQPGEGPFHIKATGYLGHMRRVEASYPGGLQAYLHELSPGVRVPAIFGQYFDFAQPKLIDSDGYHARFEFPGLPWLLADWVQAAYDGFSSVVLKAAGATAPNIEAERVPSGTIKGYPSCRLVITNQWS